MNLKKSLMRQLPALYKINSGTIHKRCYAPRCQDIKLDTNFEIFLNNILMKEDYNKKSS